MGRRKKGNPVNGWVIVDKPLGVSSTQVVGKVRWAFNAQKAGHAGTLDPLASGVLAVALGDATKTVPYQTDAIKAYRFIARFGQGTTTDDAEGEICKESDNRPSDAEIEAAIPRFVGDIMQVPPIYSAIKVDGARAYDLARAGEEVELKARPLHVESLKLIKRIDEDHAEFELVCGKGGYVRSVARDLGEALGCFSYVTMLRRIWSGGFDVKSAISLEKIQELRENPSEAGAFLQPVQAGLFGMSSYEISLSEAKDIAFGRALSVNDRDIPEAGEFWLSYNQEIAAIARKEGDRILPSRVFSLTLVE